MLREQIDALDQQLLDLLNQRAARGRAGRRGQEREGTPFFRPDRVAQVIEKIRAQPGPLKSRHVAAIWREIMSACLALESPQRVAVPRARRHLLRTGGHRVLRRRRLDQCYCATSTKSSTPPPPAARRLRRGRRRELHRRRGHPLARPVPAFAHACRRRSEPAGAPQPAAQGQHAGRHRGVLAHPQALAQCQNWLSKHLPNAERRAGLQQCRRRAAGATNPAWAALASERAGHPFGLHIVAPRDPGRAYNRTRFAVICLPQTLAMPPATGRDCTSLVVSVPNRPGAVHDLLVPLKNNGVSMTRFESRPARTGQWEYYFYIDLDGHPVAAPVAAALAELRRALRLLQGAGRLPVQLSSCLRPAARTGRRMFEQARSDRLRPDGRLLRAGAEARRSGQARGRLQQVAFHHGARRSWA